MSRRSKTLTALLAAAAVTVAAVLVLTGSAPDWVSPELPAPSQAAGTTPQADPRTAPTGADEVPSDADRHELKPPGAGSEPEQGLRGRVTRQDGVPVAGAELVLYESYHRKPLDALLDARRNAVRPPIARALSDSSGGFSIGVQRVTPEGYELLVSQPDFAHQTVPSLTLFEGRWTEIDDIRLDQGVLLEGRVSVQGGNGLPVAGATVAVTPSGLGTALQLTTQRGTTRSAATNAGGYYRIEHCPTGHVDVTAVASNFALVRRESVRLDPALDNRVDFELPKGFAISGAVLDDADQPIGGAVIEVFELNARSSDSISARSDAEGRFELIGLVDAAYQLRASATGYVREERKPVRPGKLDQALVLQRQGAVQIEVRAPDGRPVTRFDAEIKISEEGNPRLGSVLSARIHRVVPDALTDGGYTIDALDPGSYVVQIQSRNYAKTFSERFTIERGGPLVRLQITLLDGGLIQGALVDRRGNPIAGASIETLDGSANTSPLARLFKSVIVSRVTETGSLSRIDGRFEIPHLAPGSYQLRLRHPEHAELMHGVIEVLDRQVHSTGSIELQRGAAITGTAILDGAPAGQIQVTVSSLPNQNDTATRSFHAETTSDDSGHFRIAERLPPGRYQARAARQTLDSPLLKVVDFTNTRQDFQIVTGQESLRLHFSLTSN